MDRQAVTGWTIVNKIQRKDPRGGTHLVLVVQRGDRVIESNVSGATWDTVEIGQVAPRLAQTEELEREVLREENVALRKRIAELENAIVLPGWTCPKCKAFTGEAKERHESCIHCDGPRP